MRVGISLEEAIRLMTEGIAQLEPEQTELSEALGRTLAEDILSPMDQPPFDRSPLDGYALRAEDTVGASRETPVYLTVTDTVYAGQAAAKPLGPGEAIKVTTGAPLPRGCTCVIRQEATDRGAPQVAIYQALKEKENCCFQGEDCRAGAVILPAGTRIDAASVAVLASVGYSDSLAVFRRPAVGVLSTGDEIVPAGTALLPAGKIYSSNESYLKVRLRELGVNDVTCATVPDDPEKVAEALVWLTNRCDMVITTGGVSVGEKDIVHEALPLLGAEQVFWRVDLKPGSPALFSRLKGKPVLSLSGNPFAAAATFELLARPLLKAFSGEAVFDTKRTNALLATEFRKSSPMRRFLRGRYEADGWVWLPKEHSSGVLRSLVGCNCLVDIPAGSGPFTTTDEVTVVLL